jgi:serine/threonine protein kinase
MARCSICGAIKPTPTADCPECSTARHDPIQLPSTLLHDKTPKDPSAIAAKGIDPLIGKSAGNYRIEALIGSGGMGAVYRAFHPGLDRAAAVKVLRAELSEEPGLIERFFREAKATNQIRHPGIVDIFDLGSMDNGRCYMVMQLLEGESLEQYASRHGVVVESVVTTLGKKILDILSAAHKKGIIHRDLKPANIFLEQSIKGRTSVKLLDFGIAKILLGGTGLASTAEGTLLGTPRYMPPEQARSPSSIDVRADFYSLGAILYELATGHPIFAAKTPLEMLQKHQQEMPRSPRALRPQLSKEFESAILRALSKDPKDRFPDCESFIAALNTSDTIDGDDDQGDNISTILDPNDEIRRELSFEPDTGNTLDVVQRASNMSQDETLPPVAPSPALVVTLPAPVSIIRTDIDPTPAPDNFKGAPVPDMAKHEETMSVAQVRPQQRQNQSLWLLVLLLSAVFLGGAYALMTR